MFVFTWVGAFGVVVGLAMFALAAVAYRAGSNRLQGRLLAIVLVIDGLNALLGSGLMYLTDDPRSTYAWQVTLFVLVLGPAIALYPMFWGTLPTPLGRPFRTRAYAGIAAVIIVACTAYVLVRPRDFVHEIVPGPYSPWDAVLGGSAVTAFFLLFLTTVGGFVVAVHAWRRTARGSLNRRRTGLYALAFGIRDSAYLVIIVGVQVVAAGLLGPRGAFVLLSVLPSALLLLFGLLLTYGILTAHLFDIDLKIKWTLSRGTVATAFLLVFFVVSQLIERLASEKLGYISGAAAAGVLLLAINPLQKTADKFADKAMPKTEATPAYVAFRKMEVYKAAVEEVLADGKVSDKDRRVLDRLRTQLGLAASDAGSMERDIAALRGLP